MILLRFRAMPALVILVANVVFITIAPRAWFEILVLLNRWLTPVIGRALTTYIQALLTVMGGVAWLYLWREGFRRLFRRLLKERAAGTRASCRPRL